MLIKIHQSNYVHWIDDEFFLIIVFISNEIGTWQAYLFMYVFNLIEL